MPQNLDPAELVGHYLQYDFYLVVKTNWDFKRPFLCPVCCSGGGQQPSTLSFVPSDVLID